MASDSADTGTVPPGVHDRSVNFTVDGAARQCTVDVRTTVLDALRDRLDVMSPKKGCDHGQCGSCTVLLDGHRVVTCLALAVAHDGAEIVTAAGLADDGPHLLQERFLEEDAFQCGYCTPGQICSAVGMLDEYAHGDPSYVTEDLDGVPDLDDDEIRERMSGNLCRCVAYPRILDAIRTVAEQGARR